MSKRGQGLPINTLIVAIIALIVLAIIIFIFRDQVVNIASSFTGISSEAGKQAENASKVIGDVFN